VNAPTFTPDQFTKVLKEKGFKMTVSPAVTPQGQPAQLSLFSKENLIIFFSTNPQNPTQVNIIFQVLNTINIKSALNGGTSPNDDIRSILMGSNIEEDVVSTITFSCTTRQNAIIDPMKGLTDAIKPKLLEQINKALRSKLNLISLQLGTTIPVNLMEGKDSIQLVLEPLGTDPTKKFFVSLTFQTRNMRKFDEFINGFGEDVIRSVIEAITSV